MYAVRSGDERAGKRRTEEKDVIAFFLVSCSGALSYSNHVLGSECIRIVSRSSLSCSLDRRPSPARGHWGGCNTPTEPFPTLPGGKYAGQGKVTCGSPAQSASTVRYGFFRTARCTQTTHVRANHYLTRTDFFKITDRAPKRIEQTERRKNPNSSR